MSKRKEQTEVVMTTTLPSIESLNELGYKNKSEMIRYLDSEGYGRKDISNHLKIRYQHVRNVLITPLKRVVKDSKDETSI